MCGLFSIRINPFDTFHLADRVVKKWQPIDYARPGEWLPIMTQGSPQSLTLAYWGFAPHWLNEPRGKFVIHARAETIASKPYFRTALAYHRCLIPADGFYEWETTSSGRQPYYFTRRDQRPFLFAGVADELPDQTGNLGFAIITTLPNELVAPIHDRMPVIFDEEQGKQWLVAIKPAEAVSFLGSYPAALMTKTQVTRESTRPKRHFPNIPPGGILP